MKKLAVILAALMLFGCTSAEEAESRTDDSSGFMSILGEAFKETVDSIIASNDYSGLSTEKHGYGQGVQLDNENRPAGAIDFNNVYGKYNDQDAGGLIRVYQLLQLNEQFIVFSHMYIRDDGSTTTVIQDMFAITSNDECLRNEMLHPRGGVS